MLFYSSQYLANYYGDLDMRIRVDFASPVMARIPAPRPVSVWTVTLPPSFEREAHMHDRGQLIHASRGILNVTAPAGTWVVPPQRAVWIPAFVPHAVHTSKKVEAHTVYIDPTDLDWLPVECRVLRVRPLLRELILEAIALPENYPLGGREEALMELLTREVTDVATGLANLHLPEPKDRRLAPIVRAVTADPADVRSREDWAKRIGASARTIDRLFGAETGMTFAIWKRQALLLESMRRLAEGQSVTNVAMDLGYDNLSAFIAMFKRGVGVTPSQLFK